MNPFPSDTLGVSKPIQPFDINSATQEIKNIDAELLRVQTFQVNLKRRKEKIEKDIKNYLSVNNHKGVVINDMTIVTAKKTKNKKPSKKEQEQKMLSVLQQHGLSASVLKEIQQATQGEVIIEDKLTITYGLNEPK